MPNKLLYLLMHMFSGIALDLDSSAKKLDIGFFSVLVTHKSTPLSGASNDIFAAGILNVRFR
jgi:hypothetical protein